MTSNRYLEASPEGDRGEAAIIGIPFDGTASYRPGTRFGPSAIREASQSLETFSPFIDKDLLGRDYLDWGDIEVAPGRADLMVAKTEEKITEILNQNLKPVILGGEHTITLGVIKALIQRYPDMAILQLDAHADFRQDYLGEKLSHATVMRRISEIIPAENIYRSCIRAGTREEMVDAGIKLPLDLDCASRDMNTLIRSIPADVPLYVTVDMDVFDPSLVPGVGNPEPQGLTWREFIQLVRALEFRNTIGFDVVELSPGIDQTGVSAVVAASVVRELMLSMMK